VHANEIVAARTVRGDRKATKPKPTRIAYFVVMVAPPIKSALNLQQSRYPAWNMRKQRLCQNLDCQPLAYNFIYCASFFTVSVTRKASHRFAGSGFLGAGRIQREMVPSETSNPSIKSSPWIRWEP
jgi:hypothetical protein